MVRTIHDCRWQYSECTGIARAVPEEANKPLARLLCQMQVAGSWCVLYQIMSCVRESTTCSNYYLRHDQCRDRKYRSTRIPRCGE